MGYFIVLTFIIIIIIFFFFFFFSSSSRITTCIIISISIVIILLTLYFRLTRSRDSERTPSCACRSRTPTAAWSASVNSSTNSTARPSTRTTRISSRQVGRTYTCFALFYFVRIDSYVFCCFQMCSQMFKAGLQLKELRILKKKFFLQCQSSLKL